jgi:hypothetical protein
MIRTCLFQDPFYLYMEDQIVRSLLPHTKDLARATDRSLIRDRCLVASSIALPVQREQAVFFSLAGQEEPHEDEGYP